MFKRTLVGLLVSCASLLAQQLDSNTITVTASRSASLTPDQVVFYISVDTPITAALSDVLASVQSAGLTAADFSGVESQLSALIPTRGAMSILTWDFTLPVALSQMAGTIANLTKLQQGIGATNPGFNVSFGVSGVQVSQQLLQTVNCAASDLVSDGRAKAQKLAAAAAVTLGPII